jgi:hypothetical protein
MYSGNASPFRQGMICYALGEIGSAPHSSVREFLEARTRSSNFALRLQAAIALFKTFIKNEGLFRLNHKGKTRAEDGSLVNSL